VTRLRAGQPRNRGSIPDRCKIEYYLLQHVQTGYGPPSLLLSGYLELSPRAKTTGAFSRLLTSIEPRVQGLPIPPLPHTHFMARTGTTLPFAYSTKRLQRPGYYALQFRTLLAKWPQNDSRHSAHCYATDHNGMRSAVGDINY
jgi:hypothetical protein